MGFLIDFNTKTMRFLNALLSHVMDFCCCSKYNDLGLLGKPSRNKICLYLDIVKRGGGGALGAL